MAETDPELPHRNDAPPELLEAIKEFEQQVGSKVIFIGDMPSDQIPVEADDAYRKYKAKMDGFFFNGQCLDCHETMPGWPAEGNLPDDWELPTGWKMFKDVFTGEPCGWQCPKCHLAESDEDED